MSNAGLTRREIRLRSRQLSALLCDWDPIGLMGDLAAPQDEYDCLVGPLLNRLQASADADLAEYLRHELEGHFGWPASRLECDPVAVRIRQWFTAAWRDVSDKVTIYVAVLNEGVDVWRPVEARPLGNDCFRIVGVDADVSDETWQFSEGAVVRCEAKQFADGRRALTAVEEISTCL